MDGQYETFVTVLGALGKLVLAATIVERVLAFIFEHKWFIYLFMREEPDMANPGKTIFKSKIPGLKGVLALAASLGISFRYKFDIMNVIFPTHVADEIGMLITGFVIAGGSAGAIAIFQGYLSISKESRDANIKARKAEAESAKEIAEQAALEAKAKREKAEAEKAEAQLRRDATEAELTG